MGLDKSACANQSQKLLDDGRSGSSIDGDVKRKHFSGGRPEFLLLPAPGD